MLRIGGRLLAMPSSKLVTLPLENGIPIVLLAVFGALSIRGPIWTVISFLMLIRSLQVIYRRVRKKCTSFYFSFTLSSIIGAHLVYEIIGNEFMRITYLEYITNVFLFTLTLFMMHKTRISVGKLRGPGYLPGNLRQNENSSDDPDSVERHKLAMAQEQIPSYNYCRRCEATIPGRDHHCVWLNVCIGKGNRYWFLGCLTIGACWIAMIANIFLTSVCYPVSIFSSGLFGRGADGKGPVTWFNHYGLIPVTCPEAYVKTSVTIAFVTSMYGLLVLIFLLAILAHQLRLLYKGVSYLELKYAGTTKRPRSTELPLSSPAPVSR